MIELKKKRARDTSIVKCRVILEHLKSGKTLNFEEAKLIGINDRLPGHIKYLRAQGVKKGYEIVATTEFYMDGDKSKRRARYSYKAVKPALKETGQAKQRQPKSPAI